MKFEATLMAVALIASEVSPLSKKFNYESLFAFNLENHSSKMNFFPFDLGNVQIKSVSEFIRTKQNRLIISITNIL